MNLQLLANIADILAAIGVIISLLIVAMELRKNTAQSQVSNTYALFTMMSEYKRRTDRPHVADLIVRGRSDFQTLSEPDKIAFGYWMEEMIYAAYCAYRSEGAIGLAEGGTTSSAVGTLAIHFKHPGAGHWYQWSGRKEHWAKEFTDFIEAGITKARAHQADGKPVLA